MAKKDSIIDWLKKMGRISTTQICGLINADYNTTLKYLQELKEEKKIIDEKETRATYWKLKEKKGAGK